jgi:hypothetical protein
LRQASKRRRTHDETRKVGKCTVSHVCCQFGGPAFCPSGHEDNRQATVITLASKLPALCAAHTGVRHMSVIPIPHTLPAVRSSSLESLNPLHACPSTDSPLAIAVQVSAAVASQHSAVLCGAPSSAQRALKRAANPPSLPRAKVKPKVQPPRGVKRTLVFNPGPRLRQRLSEILPVVPISNNSPFPDVKEK